MKTIKLIVKFSWRAGFTLLWMAWLAVCIPIAIVAGLGEYVTEGLIWTRKQIERLSPPEWTFRKF